MESSVHTAEPSAHVQIVATASLKTYVCARRKQYSYSWTDLHHLLFTNFQTPHNPTPELTSLELHERI